MRIARAIGLGVIPLLGLWIGCGDGGETNPSGVSSSGNGGASSAQVGPSGTGGAEPTIVGSGQSTTGQGTTSSSTGTGGAGGAAQSSSSAGQGGAAQSSSSAGQGGAAQSSSSAGQGGAAQSSSSAGQGGAGQTSTSAGQGGAGSTSSSAGQGGAGSTSSSAGQGGAGSTSSSAGQGGAGSTSSSAGQGGAGGGSACVSCNDVAFNGADPAELCPDSATIFDALGTCLCATTCAGQCGNNLCVGVQPSAGCVACAQDTQAGCGNDFSACINDNGGGGTGGGGTGGGSSCEKCSQVITGGDPAQLCPGTSETLYGDLVQCTCGGPCAASCGNNICIGTPPDQACQLCVINTQTGCGNQFNACNADN